MKINDPAAAKAVKVNLLAQEIKFAKLLAGNDPNVSVKEKQLKKLKTWLKSRASCSFEFTDNDCLRIWKGLFYSMWMSDKPLPQENLATQIASLIHCFENAQVSVKFFAMFLQTMANEWNGIDQWRIDKFMMLVRRVLRELFVELKDNEWDDELVKDLSEKLKQTVLGQSTPRGLFMHFTEIFLEELAKVSGGDIETSAVTQLLDPFIHYVATQSDTKLVRHVLRNVFNGLLFQSEMGREYRDKYDAWKEMGFPGTSVNDIALEELENEELEEENGGENDEDIEDTESGEEGETNGDAIEEEPLDPRAGRVDVVMPVLEFDAKEIANIAEGIKYKKFTRAKNRKTLDRIINTYKTFATGTFPIGIQKLGISRDDIEVPSVDEKADELLRFEDELYGEQRQLKKLNKRKRKRLIANPDALEEEFQTKAKKVAKHKRESNSWIEEDMPQNESLYSDTEETVAVNGKEHKIEENPTNNKDISNRKLKKKAKNHDDCQKLNSSNQTNKVCADAKTNDVKVTPTKEKNTVSKSPKVSKTPNGKVNEWSTPLKEGETEYFIPSKKLKAMVPSTIVEGTAPNGVATPKSAKKAKVLQTSTPVATPVAKSVSTALSTPVSTPGLSNSLTASVKKNVKIMLKMNQSQEAVEYLRQVQQSPNMPYDSDLKPLKGALKPNLMPSPINPFYKKQLGLKF